MSTVLLLFAALAAAVPSDEIAAMRARSNAAIAAHDSAALQAVTAPGYTIIPGSLGTPMPADGFTVRIGKAFADPTFVTYVRTPSRIAVADNGKRAAETGTWIGTWRKPDGKMRLSGVYQATWVPGLDGWKLLNEAFVSLACTGSEACPDVE